MKTKLDKFIVVLVAIVAFAGIAYFGAYLLGDEKVDPVLKSVSETDPIRKNCADKLGVLGIESVKDVGYYFEDDESITIKYGKHDFKVLRKYIKDEEVVGYLTALHLEIKTTEKGNMIVYYKGAKVEKLVS